MASLQKKGDSWYCQFMHGGKRHTYTIGEVGQGEAKQWATRTDQLLMRLKQGLLELPPDCPITEFIRHDGKPPIPKPEAVALPPVTTLHQLREAYLAVVSHGAIENNTLDTSRIHLTHLEVTYGETYQLNRLTMAELQRHVTRRQGTVSPVTIKKEMDTFRAVWNWGARMGMVSGAFPSKGLVYPKTDEKPPFMSWGEIARRVKSGAPATLWECLYLNTDELTEFLAYAKGVKTVPGWVYPMLVAAAYTGARRSELLRSHPDDFDLTGGVLLLREKKRARGKRTSRHVPITSLLSTVIKPLIEQQQGQTYLFGDGLAEITDQIADKRFTTLVAGSKWKVVKGWHCLRHSFISACASKGVDQRLLDSWVGHSTDEQRQRYRHLYPNVQSTALNSVFA